MPGKFGDLLSESRRQPSAETPIFQGIHFTRQCQMPSPGLFPGLGGLQRYPSKKEEPTVLLRDLGSTQILAIQHAFGVAFPWSKR